MTALLTTEQVAEMLGVSPRWVSDHAARNHRPYLPAIRVGKFWRFDRASIEKWLKELEKVA